MCSCKSAKLRPLLWRHRHLNNVLSRGGRKNWFSDASRFSLVFFPHMARVRARDAAGFIAQNLRIAWQCVLPPAVFYFRYAFIYTVWNAVLLDAKNSHTDRLSPALCDCLSWSSIAAAVKCTCIFEYFYTKLIYTQWVMFSEQDKTSDISK